MAPITAPSKPFANYKWRWATLTPTEGLNNPPVFLGVLRVFERNENSAPSSDEVRRALEIVQNETKATVDLVRTAERNLYRNSSQYWKAVGLLADGRKGEISLTNFGREVARGEVTQVEFATTVVKTFELPNRRIETNTTEWDVARLKIKPFEVILKILARLAESNGRDEGYITPEELVTIIIPLAGDKADLETHVTAILQVRQGLLDVSSWPDCAPDSNDKRMAAEYLLFLAHYGFCSVQPGAAARNSQKRFFLSNISQEEIAELESMPVTTDYANIERASKEIRLSHIPAIIERRKVSRDVLERPYQATFRRNVLSAYHSTCLITGVSIESVLEAAHIIPVKENGSDQIDNGICLRSDIHQLFDTGHIRLQPSGSIVLSDLATLKNNYGHLPNKIEIPPFVDRSYLEWRMNYL